MTVNNTANPIHIINFLNSETSKDGFLYRISMKNAQHWHGIMEILIKCANIEDRVVNTVDSIADEIKKLSELQDSGVLSIDEFKKQKSKLLGM